jgi:hypothetical protein
MLRMFNHLHLLILWISLCYWSTSKSPKLCTTASRIKSNLSRGRTVSTYKISNWSIPQIFLGILCQLVSFMWCCNIYSLLREFNCFTKQFLDFLCLLWNDNFNENLSYSFLIFLMLVSFVFLLFPVNIHSCLC